MTLFVPVRISGTSAEKRPDFQRLLSDCRRGRIDKVLVKSISRFARNAKDCLETVRELKSIGVGVCFEEQNIDTSNMSGELLPQSSPLSHRRRARASPKIYGGVTSGGWRAEHSSPVKRRSGIA